MLTDRRRRAAHRLVGLCELSRARADHPLVSVAVVSYRRHRELAECLRDLDAQRTTIPFEVVLVMQAFPSGVPEDMVAEFGTTLDLSAYHVDRGLGIHAARNAAIARSSGDIIAFLDDDVRIPPGWLETLVSYYRNPAVGGVGGFVRHPGSRRLSTRLLRPVLGLSANHYRIDWGGFHAIPWASHPEHDQDADWLSGCNMSFRRAALEQVGGFDEGYGLYGYDDVDVGLRVRQAGWRLVSSRRLTVAHYPSPVNRAALPDYVREDEARRVRFVRRAIGGRPGWRTRYVLRLSWHLVALALQGIARGCPSLPIQAIRGARRGLAQYGQPTPT